MRCRIADLIVEIPEAGGLAPRCRSYLYSGEKIADIVILEELYKPSLYPATLTAENLAYAESGRQFCARLLNYNGFYLHASAVSWGGSAYLFSADPGVGKSTHTRLWQQTLGDAARVFNDDKPALRLVEDCWYAYGTPWCGKDGVNINLKVPLAGICFLRQAGENSIRRLSPPEALPRLLPQTIRLFRKEESLDVLLGLLEKLISAVPVFELKNRPEPEAAMLSQETMVRAAKEQGLCN